MTDCVNILAFIWFWFLAVYGIYLTCRGRGGGLFVALPAILTLAYTFGASLGVW